RDSPYSLVFNRMSPSAYMRDGVQGIFYTHVYLAYLERLGVPVVNGRKAWVYETSKALQIELMESLGLPYPRARVINHAAQAPAAAEGLRFPVVVKANVGGSGAGIVRYDRPDGLSRAAAESRARGTSTDVCGIEYMIDDRDDEMPYYDINALSNFVADARNVVGFDPFERLVDFLESVRDASEKRSEKRFSEASLTMR